VTGGAGADPHLANGFALGSLFLCLGKNVIQTLSAQCFRSRHLLVTAGGCQSRGCHNSHEDHYPYAMMSHLLKGLDSAPLNERDLLAIRQRDPICETVGVRFHTLSIYYVVAERASLPQRYHCRRYT
jgi:hypothetical protein